MFYLFLSTKAQVDMIKFKSLKENLTVTVEIKRENFK